MKDNQHVKPIIDIEAGTVTFQIKGMDDLVFNISKVHPNLVKRAALVGFAQVRIVDSAAIPMTRKDGSIIPEAERIATKRENMEELIEHYESGTELWSRVSEGGGGKSITVEAIARVKGMTYEEAEAEVAAFAEKKYEGDTKKALAFLRQGARVMAAMDAIKAERTKPAVVDADAALDELTKGE